MNPSIINVSPPPNMTDVILGSSIVVTFSEPIDTDSFNNSTFALTGPNFSSIVTPSQLIESNPMPGQGRGYILGTFGFSTLYIAPWAAFTAYNVGAQAVDSNGNVQTVSDAGVSSPYAPAWLTTTADSTVDNNLPIWQPLQTWPFGQYILDSNSNIQKVTVTGGGTTGTTAPQWNRTTSGTTFDGSLIWTNYGTLQPIVWVNGGPYNSGGNGCYIYSC